MVRVFLLSLFLLSLALPGQAGYRFDDRAPVGWTGRAPDSYAVHGLDVARFQDRIDWRKAKRAGVAFVFIKATEGGDLLDPMFDAHWSGARSAGIPRGAYHFYYFCRPAREQAAWFIQNVPRRRGTLPPVLDMEWNPHSPTCIKRPAAKEVRRQAQIFLTMVEKHYGLRPIIYTTPEFYRQNQMGKLPGVEFWLRSTAKSLEQVYPDQHWKFWQYTSTGVVPGVTDGVDVNVFNGSADDWQKWLRSHRR